MKGHEIALELQLHREEVKEREYFVVYKLDNATPQAYASEDGTLIMSELPPGVHALAVQLLTREGLPLTAMETKSFQVGEKLLISPETSEAARSWYSVYPRHLLIRRHVLKLRGNEVAAELTGMAAGIAGVAEEPESQFTRRLNKLPGDAQICPSKYLLYRSPVHGLNNQKLDVFNAVAVANAIGRVLVLPYLFGGLLDGGESDVFGFGEVWDIGALKRNLAEYVCFATFDDLAKMEEYNDDVVRVVEHGTLQGLEFYSELFGGIQEKFVMLDRPEGMLSQFPLDIQNLPEVTSQIRQGEEWREAKRRSATNIAPSLLVTNSSNVIKNSFFSTRFARRSLRVFASNKGKSGLDCWRDVRGGRRVVGPALESGGGLGEALRRQGVGALWKRELLLWSKGSWFEAAGVPWPAPECQEGLRGRGGRDLRRGDKRRVECGVGDGRKGC